MEFQPNSIYLNHFLFKNHYCESDDPFELMLAAKGLDVLNIGEASSKESLSTHEPNIEQQKKQIITNIYWKLIGGPKLTSIEPIIPSDMDIEQFLITEGIIPSAQKAAQIFWGLGDAWWRQIIDGKYQEYGPQVFDEGLHPKKVREPGFLNGIKEASEVLSNRLGEELSVELYHQIHYAACKHFRGSENNTLANENEVNRFRERHVRSFFPEDPKIVQARAEELNNYFEQFAKEINLKNPITCCLTLGSALDLNYRYNEYFDDPDLYKQVTERLIRDFNEDVKVARRLAYTKIVSNSGGKIENQLSRRLEIQQEYQTTMIHRIAKLYAELEWTHPWIDGQGRTDLILLSGLLSKEGLHPCILQEPYFSSTHLLDEWVEYLKNGLHAYEKVYCQSKEDS